MPASCRTAWHAELGRRPLCRAAVLQLLTPALGGVLWRTRKADLSPAELGIPAQTSHTTRLALSQVERFFYARQHQACPG